MQCCCDPKINVAGSGLVYDGRHIIQLDLFLVFCSYVEDDKVFFSSIKSVITLVSCVPGISNSVII